MSNERRRNEVLASIIDQVIEMRAHRGLLFAAEWLAHCGIDERIVTRVLCDTEHRRPAQGLPIE